MNRNIHEHYKNPTLVIVIKHGCMVDAFTNIKENVDLIVVDKDTGDEAAPHFPEVGRAGWDWPDVQIDAERVQATRAIIEKAELDSEFDRAASFGASL